MHEAYESLNSHEYFGVVSLDLSKAFDTVDHRILLYKLHNFSIRGIAHNILKSYLSNCMQFVSVNDVTSDHLPIKVGVSQDSVLGPLLFLIYINDMPRCAADDSALQMYADHSILFSSKSDIDELSAILNTSLNNLYIWLNANYLTFNLDKLTFSIITLT